MSASTIGARGTQIKAANQGMRVRAASESGDANARGWDVIDEASCACHQRLVFEAKNARADCARAHWPALDIALAALARTSLGVA